MTASRSKGWTARSTRADDNYSSSSTLATSLRHVFTTHLHGNNNCSIRQHAAVHLNSRASGYRNCRTATVTTASPRLHEDRGHRVGRLRLPNLGRVTPKLRAAPMCRSGPRRCVTHAGVSSDHTFRARRHAPSKAQQRRNKSHLQWCAEVSS